ncbi:hypothetical protein D3C81_1887190 [compost metagenome]
MIAKRPFRLRLTRINLTRNDKISIRADAEAVDIAVAEVASAQQTGEGHLTEAFRQRHNS